MFFPLVGFLTSCCFFVVLVFFLLLFAVVYLYSCARFFFVCVEFCFMSRLFKSFLFGTVVYYLDEVSMIRRCRATLLDLVSQLERFVLLLDPAERDTFAGVISQLRKVLLLDY